MYRRKLLFLALAAPLCLALPVAAAEPLPPANHWLPEDAILAVEIPNPQPILDLVTNPKTVEAIEASPLYQKAGRNPAFQGFLQGVAYFQFRLGTDWKTAVKTLLGGGVSWAVTADGANLLVIDSTDAALLQKVHDLAVEIARNEAEKQSQPERVKSADYRGVTGWSLSPALTHALVGSRLIVANKAQALRAAIDRKADKKEGLAGVKDYRAAQQAQGDGVARAYVNLGALKKHPPIEKALGEDKNPMAALLLAGVREALRESNWLAMKLRMEGTDLALQATVDGRPGTNAEQVAFAWPKGADQGALPNLQLPRSIAEFSFYRDLEGFYAAKDKLFPERTSGLIFFENMMGIFFSGRDLAQDILAQPKPEVRFVVARQEYDPEIGTPQVQIPGFAAIFRLKKPKQYADVVEEAWQKAVGLISVTRGQKADAGLLIDKPTHNGTRYSVAYFPKRPEDTGPLGMHFNFRPSLVKLGEYAVFSSSEGLARDLIDALKGESAKPATPVAGVNTLVDFHSDQLATILEANQTQLVRNNMVEKGNSKEQAESEIGVLTMIAKYFGDVRLRLGQGRQGFQAVLNVKLNLPAAR